MSAALWLVVIAYWGGMIDTKISRDIGYWHSVAWCVFVAIVTVAFANWQGLA